MALRNVVKVGDPILNKKSRIVEKYVGNNQILQMPFNRHSSGYVIKE